MPYNPAGLFSLVASYFATPGTTIRTEQHNPVFEDVGSALSAVLLRDGRAPMTGPLNMNGFPINNAEVGNTPGSVATLAQAFPIGGIIGWTAAAAPSGWMLCYGQAISRTTYAALFTIIGTTFGVGDGSTTFNLPDLRGRVSAGVDNMGGVAAGRLNSYTLAFAGGAQNVTLAISEMPAHDHGGATAGMNANAIHNHGITGFGIAGSQAVPVGPDSGAYPAAGGSVGPLGLADANINHLHSIQGQGGSAAHNNIQPTIALNKIIRVSYDG